MKKIFFESRTISLGGNNDRERENKSTPEFHYGGKEELADLLSAFSENEQMEHIHLVHDDLAELEKAVRSFFTCIHAGGGLVLNARDEFLAILRNGVWDLPKGKLEEGEDFKTAALREVEEETGLKDLSLEQELGSTFHTYELKGNMILKETRWFQMKYRGSAQPVLQGEEGISESRWVPVGGTGFMMNNTYASIIDVLKLGKRI